MYIGLSYPRSDPVKNLVSQESHRQTLDQFIAMNKGINGGEDLNKQLLVSLILSKGSQSLLYVGEKLRNAYRVPKAIDHAGTDRGEGLDSVVFRKKRGKKGTDRDRSSSRTNFFYLISESLFDLLFDQPRFSPSAVSKIQVKLIPRNFFHLSHNF